MSATNMTITKPSMHYDSNVPFAGLEKSVANTDAIRKKQYEYSGAVVSHGGTVGATADQTTEATRNKQYEYSGAFVNHGGVIGATTDQDTIDTLKKQNEYSGAIISHGEKIEEVPEFVPKKKYMLTSVIDFFKQRQKFGRHPFVHTQNI